MVRSLADRTFQLRWPAGQRRGEVQGRDPRRPAGDALRGVRGRRTPHGDRLEGTRAAGPGGHGARRRREAGGHAEFCAVPALGMHGAEAREAPSPP